MLFNSYIFVLLFLPLTLVGYFVLNKLNGVFMRVFSCTATAGFSIAKFYLIVMSLWFYGYFNWIYLPVIVMSVCINYAATLLIRLFQSPVLRRLSLAIVLLLNFGALFIFKYYDFFVSNINTVFGTNYILHHLLLPLGISFFTFQQMSYVIDSYKGEVPTYGLLDYALFVTFFPQLIAGPIVTHNEIVPQFASMDNKRFQFVNFSKGLYAFAIGLGKKVLIADTFGGAVSFGFDELPLEQMDATNALLVMLFYTLQIYFDFSGYCDMATGIGKMFNIDIAMNFNSPYKALTITDFWKRWHITLTRFFTRYVYIPMGGSRRGSARTYIHIMTVFLLSGMWHGANWTFLLWGAVHGVFSCVTRMFKGFFNWLHPAVNWAITFLFVNLSWVIFRAPSVSQGLAIIKKGFSMSFGPVLDGLTEPFLLPEVRWLLGIIQSMFNRLSVSGFWVMLLFSLMALGAVLGMKNINERLLTFRPTMLQSATTSIILFWSIVSFSGVSVFLYFNF